MNFMVSSRFAASPRSEANGGMSCAFETVEANSKNAIQNTFMFLSSFGLLGRNGPAL
jgi:hypothetical protein